MNEIMAVEVTKKEDAFMNQIIESKGANLPSTIEDIINVFEFTDFKAKAWKILANKTSKLEEQAEIHQAAIRSGQQWGIAALYAKKRMGEITMKMTTSTGQRDLGTKEYQGKIKTLEKNGVHKKNYVFAEQMAKNPDIVDEVIESAKQHNEIPTEKAVINTIRARRVKEKNEIAKEKQEKRRSNEVTDQAKTYFDSIKGFKSALEFAITDAKNGSFAPESKNFIAKKHNELKNLMSELEQII